MQPLKMSFPKPVLEPDSKRSKGFIWVISAILFLVIASLSRIRIHVNLGFDPHLFALGSAGFNSIVLLLLIAALIAVRSGRYHVHKKLMSTALIFSVLFLLCYVAHHLLTGDTRFGDLDHDGVLSEAEKLAAGNERYLYYAILLTHIPLASIMLPFILFTTYRGLSGQYKSHKKLAHITWPIWVYVSFTGILIYIMVHPYY